MHEIVCPYILFKHTYISFLLLLFHFMVGGHWSKVDVKNTTGLFKNNRLKMTDHDTNISILISLNYIISMYENL